MARHKRENQPVSRTSIIAITVCNTSFNITDGGILHEKVRFPIRPT